MEHRNKPKLYRNFIYKEVTITNNGILKKIMEYRGLVSKWF